MDTAGIMRAAWSLARRGAARFGGRASQYIRRAVAYAYLDARREADRSKRPAADVATVRTAPQGRPQTRVVASAGAVVRTGAIGRVRALLARGVAVVVAMVAAMVAAVTGADRSADRVASGERQEREAETAAASGETWNGTRRGMVRRY
jgi:hypothetical protein